MKAWIRGSLRSTPGRPEMRELTKVASIKGEFNAGGGAVTSLAALSVESVASFVEDESAAASLTVLDVVATRFTGLFLSF